MDIFILVNAFINNLISVNTWYYALSTIAQVFAAIIGLYAIFVIFKIEKINEFLEELRSIAINLIAHVRTHQNINSKPPRSEVDEQTLLNISDCEILKQLKESISTAKTVGTSMSFATDRLRYRKMENIPSTFSTEIEKKDSIIKSCKKNLLFSFSVILSAILLLTITDVISHYRFLLFVELAWVFIVIFALTFDTFKMIKE